MTIMLLLLPNDPLSLETFSLTINLLIQSWLTTSPGVAAYAENRVKFDGAFKMALIEKLRLLNNSAIPLENSKLIKIENESSTIVCKTINTNYSYFPCKDHTIIQEKINAINIEYDIGDTLRWMTDLHKKYTKNAYVAIIVYPCTHNDKEWLKKYSIINEIIPNALKYVDFRFSNNAPGTLYFGKVEIAENELIKIQTLIHGYYNKENLVINTDKIQTKKIRNRIKFLPKNTYYDVLNEIKSELLISKKTIKVHELQNLFENRIEMLIRKENPTFNEDEVNECLLSFQSNGTGAKKAQILLNTINEKNRIHYRPSLEIDNQFNLFVYDEANPEKITFPNRKIKAFDINDNTVLDKKIFYSLKNKEPKDVIIKDSELILKKENKNITMIQNNNTKNTGILVRIDWNENKWEKPSSNLSNAMKFGFVKENNISYTSFNFAHEIYETENDGLWYGLIPAFASKTPDKEKSKNLKVIFVLSNIDKKDFIVGIYLFPKIGNLKRLKLIPKYEEYDWINIGTKPIDTIRLENYLEIDSLDKRRSIGDQEISTMGWNYVNASQVGYIFDEIEKINKENKKIKSIKLKCLKSIQ